MIDACEAVEVEAADPGDAEFLREVQAVEFRLLLQTFLRIALRLNRAGCRARSGAEATQRVLRFEAAEPSVTPPVAVSPEVVGALLVDYGGKSDATPLSTCRHAPNT